MFEVEKCHEPRHCIRELFDRCWVPDRNREPHQAFNDTLYLQKNLLVFIDLSFIVIEVVAEQSVIALRRPSELRLLATLLKESFGWQMSEMFHIAIPRHYGQLPAFFQMARHICQ